MKNKKILKSLFFVGLTLLAAIAFLVFQKAKAVIAKGLESSKSIRVVSENSCKVQKDVHFSGCNTVI